jgi:hypothetical protein
MTKRLAAIIFIFVCTSIAWAILGSTIFARTYSFSPDLKQKVASTWGTAQQQKPPEATYSEEITRTEEYFDKGQPYAKQVKTMVNRDLPLDGSRVDVGLDLEHRQKGLLWYSTYKVQFAGDYKFRNDSG